MLPQRILKFVIRLDYGIDEVSNTATAMILNISRGVSQYNFLSKNLKSDWQENTLKKLRRISECKLGVIGAGRIGGSVLLKSKSLGFQTFMIHMFREAMIKC